MKHRESPGNMGILIINDDKRRDGISNGVSSENVAANICVMTSKISE
uniref:Uncharacterized protein n=1 Tax=mine drainage metagenome TaxID=410659 RepID=E6PWM0_9ZZZZ